jgi:hypothetical protein
MIYCFYQKLVWIEFTKSFFCIRFQFFLLLVIFCRHIQISFSSLFLLCCKIIINHFWFIRKNNNNISHILRWLLLFSAPRNKQEKTTNCHVSVCTQYVVKLLWNSNCEIKFMTFRIKQDKVEKKVQTKQKLKSCPLSFTPSHMSSTNRNVAEMSRQTTMTK